MNLEKKMTSLGFVKSKLSTTKNGKLEVEILKGQSHLELSHLFNQIFG